MTEFERIAGRFLSAFHLGQMAHQTFMEDHKRRDPVLLDDAQLTMILNEVVPPLCEEEEQRLWRGFFIVGWTSLHLGFSPDESLFSN